MQAGLSLFQRMKTSTASGARLSLICRQALMISFGLSTIAQAGTVLNYTMVSEQQGKGATEQTVPVYLGEQGFATQDFKFDPDNGKIVSLRHAAKAYTALDFERVLTSVQAIIQVNNQMETMAKMLPPDAVAAMRQATGTAKGASLAIVDRIKDLGLERTGQQRHAGVACDHYQTTGAPEAVGANQGPSEMCWAKLEDLKLDTAGMQTAQAALKQVQRLVKLIPGQAALAEQLGEGMPVWIRHEGKLLTLAKQAQGELDSVFNLPAHYEKRDPFTDAVPRLQ